VNCKTLLENESVVGGGKSREPVTLINILAVGLKDRKALLELRHHLSFDLHDLHVPVINPDSSLKVFALDLLVLQFVERLLVG